MARSTQTKPTNQSTIRTRKSSVQLVLDHVTHTPSDHPFAANNFDHTTTLSPLENSPILPPAQTKSKNYRAKNIKPYWEQDSVGFFHDLKTMRWMRHPGQFSIQSLRTIFPLANISSSSSSLISRHLLSYDPHHPHPLGHLGTIQIPRLDRFQSILFIRFDFLSVTSPGRRKVSSLRQRIQGLSLPRILHHRLLLHSTNSHRIHHQTLCQISRSQGDQAGSICRSRLCGILLGFCNHHRIGTSP